MHPRSIVAVALLALASLVAPASSHAQSGASEDPARLEQNVPNPFTPGFSQTIIAYRLGREARVRVTVYNRLAQEVAVVVDREEEPGRYVVSWDGTGGNGDPVPPGIYWYDLALDGQRVAVRQMRVLESSASPEAEAAPEGADGSPLANVWERVAEALGLSGSGTAADRSSRTSWGSPR
ncbi:MAG: hypothetical protein R3326_04615 [Gemmatimonadota bacterium]|nr:hypothetical protein [Gemmatimonadota bacterium]